MIKKINGITYNPPYSFDNRTITGTTSETVISSILIPANTFQIYDIVGVTARIRKVTTIGTVVVRMRIGPTESISETLAGTFSSTTATNTIIPFQRRLSIQTLNNDTRVYPVSASAAVDISSAVLTQQSTLSIDWGVSNYITFTVQSSSVNEELNGAFIYSDYLPSISPA
jgi:hypothetical protein